ncbi:RNA 2',3'-cyclic phosphodiesterase [Tissierella sp.]|uniref:RNA 2',3'-cyclic phosphodiesterase n=1 Tax=Tissierella sp. TaxID=41274 RepID=UPI00285E2CF1|nr:RNA 2',3'-cyclic phosphodiesterase [Tissierella sp.]MDR7855958.1 RNA 2',3'-cyclic phosphodiesterase [Tissierella sp.]
MRLFIAIDFDEYVKNNINNIMESIKKYAKQGRFVSTDHMHLTLEFLGEISEERVQDIISAMKLLNAAPFTLSLSDLGYFKRNDGNIYWFGITENKDLMDIQEELHNLLQERRFKLEERDYKPHLTIGRKVKLINTFNSDELKESISKIQFEVNSIDLMESENINGKLVHTTLFSKTL